jgi:hypothetical protein
MIHDHVIGFGELSFICGEMDTCHVFKCGDVELHKKNGQNLDESTKWVFQLKASTTCDTF